MTDLRETVADDRGLIKKIQLAIPGFRGYRLKEDVRAADSLLRYQLADTLKTDVLAGLEFVRESASNNLELDLMNDIATVLSQAKTIESRIRHAEQGYSGISPAYRIGEEELNKLYEYDLSLLDGIANVSSTTAAAFDAASAGDFARVKQHLFQVRTGLGSLIESFDKRIITMAGIGAF